MVALGLDIGTTTISAVAVEEGRVLAAETLPNDAALPGEDWERKQDPRRILLLARQAVERLLARFPQTERIGVTGQQHGIVYLDRDGQPVSPLYTWQDQRGRRQTPEGDTYVARLRTLTGCNVPAGYGMVTHFYNVNNGLVPPEAAVLCTIHDLAAMTLAGLTAPAMDASDAASFGLFDLKRGRFDTEAVQAAMMDPAILPRMAAAPCLGTGATGLPVYRAIGDNQASFLGATGGQTRCMLLNMGTGSQFSVHVPEYLACEGLETRPFPTGGYLLVGAALCGGRSWALLEKFFRETAELVTGQPAGSCYAAMERALEQAPEDMVPPTVTPLFQGTRADPALRGTITGLSPDNFTPAGFLKGMAQGMAEELREMYGRYLSAGGTPLPLYGSGNGLRLNRQLRRVMEQAFGLPLHMAVNQEEAACGAALFAAGW